MTSYPMLMPSGGGGVPAAKKKPKKSPLADDSPALTSKAPPPAYAPPAERATSGPATQEPAYATPVDAAQTQANLHTDIAKMRADKRKIADETERIKYDSEARARRTDAMAAQNAAERGKIETTRAVEAGDPLDGFAYSPQAREQLSKAGADFTYKLPEDLAIKRKRLTDPGYIPPSQIDPENTPSQYQDTADRLNKKYQGQATFKYDPDTGGMVGVGGPEQQARAQQERQARLERGRADLAEARAKGTSIGDLRRQRREIAQAQHERAVQEARGQGAEIAQSPEGSAAPAFSERAQRSQNQYGDAIQRGGDIKTAARGAYRAQRDERMGPWAEKPSTRDRQVFTNHVGQLMSAKGVGSAKAKVLNEALSEISMADVRYLIQNPTLGNAAELEQLLFLDLFGNTDGVTEEDIKGLGALIMESYGVDYRGRRESPSADDNK